MKLNIRLQLNSFIRAEKRRNWILDIILRFPSAFIRAGRKYKLMELDIKIGDSPPPLSGLESKKNIN
jgi:hypothetical protein